MSGEWRKCGAPLRAYGRGDFHVFQRKRPVRPLSSARGTWPLAKRDNALRSAPPVSHTPPAKHCLSVGGHDTPRPTSTPTTPSYIASTASEASEALEAPAASVASSVASGALETTEVLQATEALKTPTAFVLAESAPDSIAAPSIHDALLSGGNQALHSRLEPARGSTVAPHHGSGDMLPVPARGACNPHMMAPPGVRVLPSCSRVLSQLTQVVYHGRCPDGLACAVFINSLRTAMGLHELPLCPVFLSNKRLPPLNGHTTAVCDISLIDDDLAGMDDASARVHVFDHHPDTARMMTACRRNVSIHYDDSCCALLVLWKWAYGAAVAPPLLFRYVDDLDCFRATLPWSRAVASQMRTSLFACARVADTERMVSMWFRNASAQVQRWTAAAPVVSAYTEAIVRSMAMNASIGYIVGLPELSVAAVQGAPAGIVPDVGSELVSHEGTDIAMLWSWSPHKRQLRVSLVSVRCDVEAVARRFGGGGHRRAAGFTTTKNISEVFCARVHAATPAAK